MNEKRIERMGRPRGSTKARVPVSEEDFQSLLMYVDQQVIKLTIAEKLRKAFTILRHTGMRASELLILDYSMIISGIEEGRFSLDNTTKTKKTRLILLTQKGREELAELFDYDENTNRSEKVFTKRNGRELQSQSFTKLLNTNIKKALGDLYTSHSFRQAYVTDLLKVAPASQVAKLVGHSNIQTTLAYDYATEDDLLGALERAR